MDAGVDLCNCETFVHMSPEIDSHRRGWPANRLPLIGNSMTYERKVLTLNAVLSQSLVTIRTTWRETFKILVLGLILPQLALNLYFDLSDQAPVAALRDLATSLARRRDTASFRVLLEPALVYASRLSSVLILTLLWTLVAYMALVHICVHHAQGGSCLSWRQSLVRGVRSAIPRGFLLLCIVLFLAGSLGQLAAAPVIIMLVLAGMVPVILAVEQRGAFWSLKTALSLGYARTSSYSGWNVFFTLMTVVAALYSLVALMSWGGQELLILDEFLEMPRTLWLWTFPGASFGPLYLFLLFLETLVTTVTFGVAPALTVAIYFAVVAKRELGQA